MTAARYNTGKPELGYLLEFPTAIKAFARVKELGAAKYERGNWKKGGKPDNEYLDACLRHLVEFVEGEYYADDSGCAHLAHAMWNIMALMELNYPGQIVDQELFDRMMVVWKAEKEQADGDQIGAPICSKRRNATPVNLNKPLSADEKKKLGKAIARTIKECEALGDIV